MLGETIHFSQAQRYAWFSSSEYVDPSIEHLLLVSSGSTTSQPNSSSSLLRFELSELEFDHPPEEDHHHEYQELPLFQPELEPSSTLIWD